MGGGDPDGLDDDVGRGNRYLDAVYDCFASCIHFGCLLDGEYPELVDVVGILLVKWFTGRLLSKSSS